MLIDGKNEAPDVHRNSKSAATERRRGERLLALLFGGFLAINYPVLSIFDLEGLVWGIPILYFYMFTAWAAIFICAALTLRKPPGQPDRRPHSPEEAD